MAQEEKRQGINTGPWGTRQNGRRQSIMGQKAVGKEVSGRAEKNKR